MTSRPVALWYALAALVGIGCAAIMNPRPKLRRNYDDATAKLVEEVWRDGDAARANRTSAPHVMKYARTLHGALMKGAKKVHEEDWRARQTEIVPMLDGVLPALKGDPARLEEAADASTLKGTFFFMLQDRTAAGSAFKEGYATKATWFTTLAYLSFMKETYARSQEALQICEVAYKQGAADKRPDGEMVGLVTLCAHEVWPHDEPRPKKEVMSYVSAEHWATHDAAEARYQQQTRSLHRALTREQEKEDKAPCLFNPKNGRYQKCTKLFMGKCDWWGRDCKDTDRR